MFKKSNNDNIRSVANEWAQIYFAGRSLPSPGIETLAGPFGSASMASSSQLRHYEAAAAERPDDWLFLLSSFAIGHDDRGSSQIIAFDSLPVAMNASSHSLLGVGASGVGKSTKLTVPAVCDAIQRNWNVIAFESKPENTKVYAQVAKACGLAITVIRPHDLTRTVGVDLSTDEAPAILADRLANWISGATTSSTLEHSWVATPAQDFVRTGLKILLEGGMTVGAALLELARIVKGGIASFASQNPGAGLERLAAYINSGANGSTVESAINIALSWTENVAVLLATPEFSLSKFSEEGGILVIEVPESEWSRFRTFTSITTEVLLSSLLRAADAAAPDSRRPWLLSFDELAAFRVDGLPTFVNLARSRGIRVLACCQSLAQLPAVYGSATDTLLAGFATQLVWAGCDEPTAKYFSQRSGTATIRVSAISESEPTEDGAVAEPRRKTWSLASRPLLLPGDIANATPHAILGQPVTFFSRELPPFQLYLVASYDDERINRHLKAAADVPPDADKRAEPLPTVSLSAVPARSQHGISNTAGWTPAQVRARMDAIKKLLEFERAGEEARRWWTRFEAKSKPEILLRTLEELAANTPTISIAEFHKAWLLSRVDNIGGNIAFAKYQRAVHAEAKKQVEAKKDSREPKTENGSAKECETLFRSGETVPETAIWQMVPTPVSGVEPRTPNGGTRFLDQGSTFPKVRGAVVLWKRIDP